MARTLRTSPRRSTRPNPSKPDFVLVVGTDRGLEQFCSSDGCPDLMQEFLMALGLAYQRPFVCASIQPAGHYVDNQEGTKSGFCSANQYGQPHILKAEFTVRAMLACAGDFQNVMSQAYLDYVRNGTPFTDYRKYFWPLDGLDEADKKRSILEAHRMVSKITKKFGDYAEVRLSGPAAATWSDTLTEEFGSSIADADGEFEIEFDAPIE